MDWAASKAYGKVARTHCYQLRQWLRSQADPNALPALLRELGTLKEIFARLPKRQVQILRAPMHPLLNYSDASWGEAAQNRVGWIVYDRVRKLRTVTGLLVSAWALRTPCASTSTNEQCRSSSRRPSPSSRSALSSWTRSALGTHSSGSIQQHGIYGEITDAQQMRARSRAHRRSNCLLYTSPSPRDS